MHNWGEPVRTTDCTGGTENATLLCDIFPWFKVIFEQKENVSSEACKEILST